MSQCKVVDCKKEISEEGHDLCPYHWKLKKEEKLSTCQKCGRPKDIGKPLCPECYRQEIHSHGITATRIGDRFGLTADKINLILAELGWIVRHPAKGWITTPQGRKHGAMDREHPQSGSPFVVWHADVLENGALNDSIRIFKGEKIESHEGASEKSEDLSFREKFPVSHRAADGHKVRSKAEMIIDNWLYMNGIVHAYERKVPIPEDLYCDFYLPTGKKVYIEYWGDEKDPSYVARKMSKQELYRKHDLGLIELTENDIKELDDCLPRKLIPFEIKVL